MDRDGVLERDDFHDIDIAIHLTKDMAAYSRFKLSAKNARSLERGVQPRVNFDARILNHVPPYFQYGVISKGVLVLESDREKRVDYEAHLISEYLDLRYMYDLINQAFLARA